MKRPAAAQTAFGPMVIAACEHARPPGQRLFDDPDAARILPAGPRVIARLCRWKPAYALLRNATDREAPGLWASMLCRKRYADDQVRAALRDGIRQFLFLGAGLDTRPYRLVLPAGARAFEVDLPANIDLKRRRLAAAYGGAPSGTTLIGADLEEGDLAAKLNGMSSEPTMVVWEAVTQYLTEEGVRGTLASLAGQAAGSRLIFTYIRRDFLDGTDEFGAGAMRRRFVTEQRIWHFGLRPGEVAGFLRDYGWTEREQAGPAEYAERYQANDVSPVERFVYADR
ncbi:class I SAM-dependent methyltransferase [Actinoplanes sp. NPDC051343]|uniref:class I SAM-dependent methyltransferase n=1 Tax=Actinoplanes sp. NPDC051343 TaxID=3363906 RepID=UPI0037AE2216